MSISRNRLERIAARIGDRERSDREHTRWVHGLLAKWVLGLNPDLRLVEPIDTDPETYAHVRCCVLSADGRHEEAEALDATLPKVPRSGAAKNATASEQIASLARWMREVCLPDINRRVELEKKAVDAARKRLQSKRSRRSDGDSARQGSATS